MLTTEAAGLVIKGAKGLIKLSRRLDLVLAEKEAATAPLGAALPTMVKPPTDNAAKKALGRLLTDDAEGEFEPPLSKEARKEIQRAIDDETDLLRPLMAKYLPEQAMGKVLDLDREFVTALRKSHPDLAQDRELMLAAFYLSAGQDTRNKSYTWRLAFTVADVAAEFGGENAALFTRDESLQKLVGSVLTRFGEADLQKTDSVSQLLRSALGATLNGALDVREAFDQDNKWVTAILDALVKARDELPETERSEFLVGLFGGSGYPVLVAAAMEAAAGRLSDDGADSFRVVATDVLNEVAAITKTKKSFKGFFEEHWGDILRAGLASVETHGPALMTGQDKLLSNVLVSVTGELSRRPNNKLLSGDVLFGIANATAAAFAQNPELVAEEVKEPWLRELVNSVSSVVANGDIRDTVSREGLEDLLRTTLARFAEQPELIVEDSGLARELVGRVLRNVSSAGSFATQELGTAAVSGALAAVADNPGLLGLKYPELIASFAGNVATLVHERGLTNLQGSALLTAATAAIAENPQLFLDLDRKLAGEVVDAVVKTAGDHEAGLIVGVALVDTVQQVLSGLARSGRAAMKNHPQGVIAEKLAELIDAGLTRAEAELGNHIALGTIPQLLGELVVAWSQGKLATIDPDNDNFRRLFQELAAEVAA